MKVDDFKSLSLTIEEFMETIGVAEAFYGEMRGNEGRITAQHLIVRKPDGDLWVGNYGRDLHGRLTPQYLKKLRTGEGRFIVPLAKPVELHEPSVLITYGERFLTLLESSQEFPELLSYLRSLSRVSDTYYEEFRGYVGSQSSLEKMKEEISNLSRRRLEEFFTSGAIEDITALTNFYELWKSATVGIFSTSENLALDTACRILTRGEEERDYLSWVAVHCKHHEEADYEETLRLLDSLLASKQ